MFNRPLVIGTIDRSTIEYQNFDGVDDNGVEDRRSKTKKQKPIIIIIINQK